MAQMPVNMNDFMALRNRNASLETEVRMLKDSLATANTGSFHIVNLIGAQSATIRASEVAVYKERLDLLEQENARLRDQLTFSMHHQSRRLEHSNGWDLRSSPEIQPTTAATSVSLLDDDESLHRYNQKTPTESHDTLPQHAHVVRPQTPSPEEFELMSEFCPPPPPPVQQSPEPVERDLGVFDFGVKGNLQPVPHFRDTVPARPQEFHPHNQHLDDPFWDHPARPRILAGPRRQFQPRPIGREQSDREYRALLGAATFIEDEVEGMTEDEVQEYWTEKAGEKRGPFASGVLLRDFYEGTVRPRYLQKLRGEGMRKAAEDARSKKKEEAELAAVKGGGDEVKEQEQVQEREREETEEQEADDEPGDLLGDEHDEIVSDRDHWASKNAMPENDNALNPSATEHMCKDHIGQSTVDNRQRQQEDTDGVVVEDVNETQSHDSSHYHHPDFANGNTYVSAGVVPGKDPGVLAAVRLEQNVAASQVPEAAPDSGASADTGAPRISEQIGSDDSFGATDKVPEEPEIQVGESALSEALFMPDAQEPDEQDIKEEQETQESKQVEDVQLPQQGGLDASKWASAAPPPPHLRSANNGPPLRGTDAQLDGARTFANGFTRGGVKRWQRERLPHRPRMQFEDYLQYSATEEMTATTMSMRRFDSGEVQQYDVPSRSGPAELELFWNRDSTDPELRRTVLCSDLPKTATLAGVLNDTQGLAVHKARFFETTKMKTNPAVGNTVFLEFLHGFDAHTFINRTTDPNHPTTKILLSTPTRPIPSALLNTFYTCTTTRLISLIDPRKQITADYVVAKLRTNGRCVPKPIRTALNEETGNVNLEFACLWDASRAWDALGIVPEFGGWEKAFVKEADKGVDKKAMVEEKVLVAEGATAENETAAYVAKDIGMEDGGVENGGHVAREVEDDLLVSHEEPQADEVSRRAEDGEAEVGE